jgi:hypothetical protein
MTRFVLSLAVLLVLLGSHAALSAQPVSDVFSCSGTVTVPEGQSTVRTALDPNCSGHLGVVATINTNAHTEIYRGVWVRSAHHYARGVVVIHLNTADQPGAEVAWVAFQLP